MTYAGNTAKRGHAVSYEVRFGSGRRELFASSASGASLPLAQVASVGGSLDPITGRRVLAGVSIEILNTSAMLQIMGPAETVQTALREQAAPEDTTIKLVVGGVNALSAALGAIPWDLQVGAESVRVTLANAVTDELTVTRAMGAAAPAAGIVDPFGTLAQFHPGGSPIGYQPQVWVGRSMTLFGKYDDGTEAALGWYAVDDLPSYQDGVWTFPCQDLLGLYNVPLGRGLGELTTATGGQYGLTSNQRAEVFRLHGERFIADDTVPNRFQLIPYRWVETGGDEATADFYYDQGGARGLKLLSVVDPSRPPLYVFPTGGIDRRRLDPAVAIAGNREFRPAPYAYGAGLDDALLQVITSRKGDGANGAWDTLPGNGQAQQGAGIPAARVNVQAFRDFFGETEAVKLSFDPGELLLDVVERELAWRRYFMTIDGNGFLTVKKITAPVHMDAVDVSLTDSSRLEDQPDSLVLAGRHVGQITVKLGWDFKSEEYQQHLVCPGGDNPPSSLGEPVTFEPRTIPAASVEDLDSFEAELLALRAEYGVRHPLFKEAHDYRYHQTELADIAGVIQPRLPAGDGTLGISAPGLVTATDLDLDGGVITLEVEAIGVARGGFIAPAGEITNVAPVAGTTYDLTLRLVGVSDFTSGLDLGGTDADEAEYFAVGWRLRGYVSTTGATSWAADVDGVFGAVLRVTVVGAAVPVVGELLTVNSYGAFGPTPTNRPGLDQKRPGLLPAGMAPGYAYLADAASTLGAGPDPAMEWNT